MTEWRAIPQLAITYEVSDDGQIVQISRYHHDPTPVRYTLPQQKKPHGYMEIHIQRDRRRQHHYVHRLVWEAFRGPIPSGLDVNHRDGNRANNRLDNLEVMTRSENMLHCFQNLKPSRNRARGTATGKAKLTPEDVKQILKLKRDGMSQNKIAKIYGTSSTHISLIFTGRLWKHITGFVKPV